jgi:hypothetical protein
MIKFDRENKGWINEEIAKGKTLTEANKNKADDKLVKAGIMKPAKGITPVIDAVTAEKQKEEIDKHVADELADKKKISLTVKAPDPKAPAPKCESFSIDVKDRNDLGKLIEGLKKDGSKFIITKSAKEGYRYTVRTAKAINESREPKLPTSVDYKVADLDIDDNNEFDNDDDLEQTLSDKLSDDYGFCHFGFKYDREYNPETKKPEGVKVTDIKWDTSEALKEDKKHDEDKHEDDKDDKKPEGKKDEKHEDEKHDGDKHDDDKHDEKHEEGKKDKDKPDPLTITLDTLAKVKDIIAKGDDEDDDAGCVEHCIELVKQNLGKKEDDDKELKAEDEPKLSDDDLDDDDNMGITLSGDGVKDFVPDADDDDISGLGFLGDK